MKAQTCRLTRVGCKKLIRDVASRAKAHRARLRRPRGQFAVGDVLTVGRHDRLARPTRDPMSTVVAINTRKAAFRPLPETWADATTANGCPLPTAQGDLAELGREPIRALSSEGRARAVARGAKMGRPPKLTPHQQKGALRRRDAAEPARENAEGRNILHGTISRPAA